MFILSISTSLLGIYGVGKAAIHQPALAILSHTPEGAKRTFAWVGKGIVYDTGGLSIKGKVNSIVLVPTTYTQKFRKENKYKI